MPVKKIVGKNSLGSSFSPTVSAGEALGILAYGDAEALSRPKPGREYQARWRYYWEVAANPRRQWPLYVLRWTLARVRWRLSRANRRDSQRRPPLGPWPERRERAHIRAILRSQGLPAPTILAAMKADYERSTALMVAHDRRVAQAEARLRAAAAAANGLTVHGRDLRDQDIDPFQHKRVPREVFMGKFVRITPFGLVFRREAASTNEFLLLLRTGSPAWTDLIFDRAEIEQLAKQTVAPPAARVSAFMLEYAKKSVQSGHLPKRADAIQECVRETQCSQRAAEAAWDALPKNQKRSRGRPPKT